MSEIQMAALAVLAVLWVGSAIAVFFLTKEDFAAVVLPGVDDAFRAFLILLGPIALAVQLIYQWDRNRWDRQP